MCVCVCVCVQFECDLLQENVTGAFTTLEHVRADLGKLQTLATLVTRAHVHEWPLGGRGPTTTFPPSEDTHLQNSETISSAFGTLEMLARRTAASCHSIEADLNTVAQTLHGRGDPAEGDEQQSLDGVLWGVVRQEQAQWAADAAAAADTAAAPDGNNSDGGGSDATVVSDEDLHYEDRWD